LYSGTGRRKRNYTTNLETRSLRLLQITPKRLTQLLAEGGESASRAFTAMMDMRKIDIAALDRAVEGVKKRGRGGAWGSNTFSDAGK
jgi:hypothetical protein